MKKTLLALAVLGSFAGAASAQSSVTLSGSLDVAVARNKGNSGIDGNPNSPRNNFTISGIEDLGNGMQATFLLNHRFSPDTGAINVAGNAAAGTAQTAPTYFWRNSWVGLGGSKTGTLRLGRILMPMQDYDGGFEAWNGGDTVGNVHTGGIYSTIRATSAAYYRSPSLGGLQIDLAVAETEGQLAAECTNNGVACTPGTKRPLGAGIRYDAGPVSVAVAYDRNGQDLKTYGLYGKYDLKVAKVMFQYEKGDSVVTTRTDSRRFSLSTVVPVGNANLKAGFMTFLSVKDATGATVDAANIGGMKKFSLGAEYNLSKRTSIYADVAKPTGAGWKTDNERKTNADLGIYHKF